MSAVQKSFDSHLGITGEHSSKTGQIIQPSKRFITDSDLSLQQQLDSFAVPQEEEALTREEEGNAYVYRPDEWKRDIGNLHKKIEDEIQKRTTAQFDQMVTILGILNKQAEDISNLRGISFNDKQELESSIKSGFDHAQDTLAKIGFFIFEDKGGVEAFKQTIRSRFSSSSGETSSLLNTLEKNYKKAEQYGNSIKNKLGSYLDKLSLLQNAALVTQGMEGLLGGLSRGTGAFSTELQDDIRNRLGYTWYDDKLGNVPILGDILEFVGITPLYQGFVDSVADLGSLVTNAGRSDRKVYDELRHSNKKLMDRLEDLQTDVSQEVEHLSRQEIGEFLLDDSYFRVADDIIRANPELGDVTFRDYRTGRERTKIQRKVIHYLNELYKTKGISTDPQHMKYIQNKIAERVMWLIAPDNPMVKSIRRDYNNSDYEYYNWGADPLDVNEYGSYH